MLAPIMDYQTKWKSHISLLIVPVLKLIELQAYYPAVITKEIPSMTHLDT